MSDRRSRSEYDASAEPTVSLWRERVPATCGKAQKASTNAMPMTAANPRNGIRNPPASASAIPAGMPMICPTEKPLITHPLAQPRRSARKPSPM